MASETKTTTDHDEIRRWVEEHDGTTASVKGTESGDETDAEDSTFFKLIRRGS